MFKRYEDLIVDALKKDGKVILEEAEKLLVSVVEGIAKEIIDIIHKISGETFNDDIEDCKFP